MNLSWRRTRRRHRKDENRAETQKAVAGEEEKRKADSSARALLFLGLLLIVIAYVVGFGFQREHLRSFAKDFLFAVATAVLVTWGVAARAATPGD